MNGDLFCKALDWTLQFALDRQSHCFHPATEGCLLSPPASGFLPQEPQLPRSHRVTPLVPHLTPISARSDYYRSPGLSVTYVQGTTVSIANRCFYILGTFQVVHTLRITVLISPRWVTFRMMIVQQHSGFY